MITSVTCSADLRQAANENLHGIITKKRSIQMAKEVNNTLGKIQADVKMELMNKAMIGDRSGVSFFDRNMIALPANNKKRLKKAS